MRSEFLFLPECESMIYLNLISNYGSFSSHRWTVTQPPMMISPHSSRVVLPTRNLWQKIWSSDFISTPFTRQEIWNLQQEVMLEQLAFMLLLNHGVRSESLRDIQTMAKILTRGILEKAAAFALTGGRISGYVHHNQWKNELSTFHEVLHQKIKPCLKEFYLGIVDRLLLGNYSTRDYRIFVFVIVILFKLKDFKKLKPNLIYPEKKQMQILEEMLNYAAIIVRKTANLDENLQNFFEFFEPWVNTAATIVILHWVDEKQISVVSSSLQKFNLSILDYVEAYILVMKALMPSNVCEILVMRNAVRKFNKRFLEEFIVFTDDGFDMFREGLAFWTALLVDPPKADAEDEKSICSQANILLDQAKSLICSLCMEKLGEDVTEQRNTLLNDFLEKINKLKAEVRQLQIHQIPGVSWNNAPETNTRAYFGSLLGNLQKKLEAEAGLFPFEKHLIAIVHKELSLLSTIVDISELQDDNENKKIQETWIQATNVAYFVDYVTDFCLSSTDIPIWSNLIHLSNAIEKIETIKNEVSKIRQNDEMYNSIICAKLNSQFLLPGRKEAYNATSEVDFKVGFVEDEQRIIDCLVAGETGRDIVAIVGMPGQGKTHLAQRVLQNTCIKDHFNKLAWCCISQACDIKMVFINILENFGENASPELSEEDLADLLRKYLKGQRYLVVLDDMWDAKAWSDLQLSFPDNNNGSRILLTSRNHNVPLEVKANCSMIELHPLSHEESWSLLSMKVFHGDCCPPTLLDIGKTIAENCKGSPLVVVVIAGVLKKDKNVDSWKQISENIKPHITSEGCMDILELSYKYLPDYLKPCFLYLGAFREDERIDAKKLIQFWLAEGFVQSDGMKTREVVAKEYLMELVSRSLVFVAQRSSRNGIKKCHVHDLLHQLCLMKVEEERFFLVPNNVSDYSSTLNNYHYCRINVHQQWEPFLDSKPIVLGLRSLLVFGNRYHYISYTGSGFLKQFKLLRVLDLTDVYITETDFHDITHLIHLRLLAVVCSFPIPASIVNLLRLEVLRFHAGSTVFLPSTVMKMANLRHIFARKCIFESVKHFGKFSPLTNLETLTAVSFYDELSFIRVAQMLPNLLKFGTQCFFCVRLSSYFKKVESLSLEIPFVGFGEKAISPSKLDFPSTLKKLNFSVMGRLSGSVISSIGKLSNLEVLKLNADLEDDRWDVEDDEFLQLKYFDFGNSSIQEWNASQESFPCLEQLLVRNCLELGELPNIFGSVTTLKKIEVQNCSASLSNSLQQIVYDQIDAGNEGLQYSIS